VEPPTEKIIYQSYKPAAMLDELCSLFQVCETLVHFLPMQIVT
jgi:hypothetical protein